MQVKRGDWGTSGPIAQTSQITEERCQTRGLPDNSVALVIKGRDPSGLTLPSSPFFLCLTLDLALSMPADSDAISLPTAYDSVPALRQLQDEVGQGTWPQVRRLEAESSSVQPRSHKWPGAELGVLFL